MAVFVRFDIEFDELHTQIKIGEEIIIIIIIILIIVIIILIIIFVFATPTRPSLEFLSFVWLPGLGYTSETFRYFFEIYVVLALFQHIFLLVVWLGAAQVTAVSDEFITAGAVGVGRKENLSECVETTASVLLQKTNNDPLVKKQVDNLLEDIRMLPRFTNQAGFSKAFKLINAWSEAQLKNFSSFAPNLVESQATLDSFVNETKLVCKSISKIQN